MVAATDKSALRSKQRRPTHAFVYRAGIGLAGTHITCDATGFASDLIFISHAHALGPGGPAKLAGERAGRRQIVATEQTLFLLGEAGDKLRSRTLPAAFGRPFNLGGQRIEVVPSGYLPGAASLLCENDGRRLFYLGTSAPEPLLPGLAPSETRHADAICVDATFADPGLVLPPRKQVLSEIRAFVQETLAENKIPVLLTSMGTLPVLAFDLAQAKIPMRAQPRFALELARLHGACSDIPAIVRVSRKPAAGQALLWPAEQRSAAAARALPDTRIALVSGLATDTEVLGRIQVDRAFPLTILPNHDEVLSSIKAAGAGEVALHQRGAEGLASELRSLGFHAYTLGPPRQMPLWA